MPMTGAPLRSREVHDLADLLAGCLGEGAAEDGEVLRVDVDEAAIDLAVAGDDGVARDALLVEAELVRAMSDQGVDLLEGALVEEDVDPLAGGELAALVLGLDALGSAALTGGFLEAFELREAVLFLLFVNSHVIVL